MALYSLAFCHTYAQKQTNNKTLYQTKIDTAGKVDIHGGKTTIIKADTVFIGQIIIDQAVPTEVFFLGSVVTQDTNGIYTTTYKFAPKVNPGTFNINVVIGLDKPFLPWYMGDPPPPRNMLILGRRNHVIDVKGDNGQPQVSLQWTTDYKLIRVRGLVAADNVYVAIRSKEKLYSTISGVAGEIH
jgi:hypothetical protein